MYRLARDLRVRFYSCTGHTVLSFGKLWSMPLPDGRWVVRRVRDACKGHDVRTRKAMPLPPLPTTLSIYATLSTINHAHRVNSLASCQVPGCCLRRLARRHHHHHPESSDGDDPDSESSTPAQSGWGAMGLRMDHPDWPELGRQHTEHV